MKKAAIIKGRATGYEVQKGFFFIKYMRRANGAMQRKQRRNIVNHCKISERCLHRACGSKAGSSRFQVRIASQDVQCRLFPFNCKQSNLRFIVALLTLEVLFPALRELPLHKGQEKSLLTPRNAGGHNHLLRCKGHLLIGETLRRLYSLSPKL